MISGIQLTSENSLIELLNSSKKKLKDDLDKNIPDILASELASYTQELEKNSTKAMLSEANAPSANMMSSNFVSSSVTSENAQSTLGVLSAKRRMASQNAASVTSLLNTIDGINLPEGLEGKAKHGGAWYERLMNMIKNAKAMDASKEELKKTKKDLDKKAEQALVKTDDNGIVINESQEVLDNPSAPLPESPSTDVNTETSADVSVETNASVTPAPVASGVTSPVASVATAKAVYKPVNVVV